MNVNTVRKAVSVLKAEGLVTPVRRKGAVLRPEWVNDYIRLVLDSDEVATTHGLLTRSHVNELWSDVDRRLRDHFLGMMDKYDLSHRIDGGQVDDVSLVVERLQWNPPDIETEWDEIGRRPNTREIRVIYVIAVAHRLQTAHDADRVVVMNEGRITETGSHDELIEKCGEYAALWRSWQGQ